MTSPLHLTSKIFWNTDQEMTGPLVAGASHNNFQDYASVRDDRVIHRTSAVTPE